MNTELLVHLKKKSTTSFLDQKVGFGCQNGDLSLYVLVMVVPPCPVLPLQCLGKLRRDHAEEAEAEAQKRWQHQRVVQQSTQSALAKLLSEVQVHTTPELHSCIVLFCLVQRKANMVSIGVSYTIRSSCFHNSSIG